MPQYDPREGSCQGRGILYDVGVKLKALGRSEIKVSAISLGTMNFGTDWHGIGAIDERTARSLVDLALDRGVNFFDTADIYGRGTAETMLGKILRGRRSKVIVATKVLGEMRPGDPSSGGLSRRHIEEGLDESLKRLGTDYVDLYMPHGWDGGVPIEETLEALSRAKAAGKVRVLGCSNFSGGQLQECLALAIARRWARFEFDQVQYSLASRFIENDLVPVCVVGDVGLLAWSPLGGGFLTGKYRGKRPAGRRRDPEKAFPTLPEGKLDGLIQVLERVARLEGLTLAQAALGWVMGRASVASAIVGARSAAQLQETLASRPLSRRSEAYLERVSDLCLAFPHQALGRL